ncbi:MAG: ankyrin repeat domain-containing protein [Candidatus Hydrogenedentes bacterium]|nr:ankyrin repeat domain-containing protein [Candidatus Hydrogenedentota bacterium]
MKRSALIGLAGILGIAFLSACGPTQPMSDAIRNVSLPDVRKHLDAGFDANGPATEHGSGNTLHYAAMTARQALKDDASGEKRQAYQNIVKWLIGAGAGLEALNDNGKTPLHLAVLEEADAVAEVLLEYGADVNARSKPEGMTPLYIDLSSFDPNDKYDTGLLELLLARGADVNIANADGVTPLHRAATNGMPEACKLLLARGANVNARDKDGRTPVTCCAVNDKRAAETVDLLLAHGADVTIPDNRGYVVNQAFIMERVQRRAGGR